MRIAICDDMQLFLDELHEMILKYCPEDLKPVMVDEFHMAVTSIWSRWHIVVPTPRLWERE